MSEAKNSFVVYTDIKETLEELDDKQVAALFRGMVDYQETGKEPNFKGSLKYIFIPIRQQMDRNNEKWEQTRQRRAESGRKGGIASGESRKKSIEANEANASTQDPSIFKGLEGALDEASKQNEANEANEAVTVTGTVTVTDTVTDTVTVGEEMSPESLSLSMINYLNEKTGASYQVDDGTINLITDLVGVGYTEADIRSVIDRKCSDWLNDPKMRQYLRPSTLFGNKFSEYLSAPRSAAEENTDKKKQNQKDLRARRNTLAVKLLQVQDAIEQEPDPDKVRPLYDQEAFISDQIDAIDKKLEAMG